MFSQNTNRRIATLVGVAAPAILVTNIAFAAWTANAEGSGQAVAGEVTQVTATATTVGVDPLYPTGATDIKMVINNPNPFNVDLSGVDFGAITSGLAACDDDGHEVSFVEPGDIDEVVGANGQLTVVLTDGASMGADSDTDCQLQTFTATVTIDGVSTDLDDDTDGIFPNTP